MNNAKEQEGRSDVLIKGKTKCLVCSLYDSGEIILFQMFNDVMQMMEDSRTGLKLLISADFVFPLCSFMHTNAWLKKKSVKKKKAGTKVIQ